MARPKNQDKRRQDIMEAVGRVIATRGLSALRRKDVAEEAGVTAPMVSYYFPDLDELLIEVYRRQIDVYMEKGSEAIAGMGSYWERLIAAVEFALPKGPHDIDSLIMYQFSGEPRFAETYSAMSARLHAHETSLYKSILDGGITDGVFKPDLDSATISRTLVALNDAYGLQVVLNEPGMDFRAARDEILKVCASLLRVATA